MRLSLQADSSDAPVPILATTALLLLSVIGGQRRPSHLFLLQLHNWLYPVHPAANLAITSLPKLGCRQDAEGVQGPRMHIWQAVQQVHLL